MFNTNFQFVRRAFVISAVFVIVVMAGQVLGDPDEKGASTARKSPDPTNKKATKVDMTPIPADETAEREALELVGDGFKVKHTAHYSVIHNVDDAEVTRFVTAIEGTYRSCMNYVDKLGLRSEKPEKKLIIFYFDEHRDYSAFSRKLNHGDRPQSQPGVYFPDLNRSLFYNYRNQDSFKAAIAGAENKIQSLRARLREPGLSGSARKQIQAEIKNAQAEANNAGRQGGDLSEGIVQHEVSHQVLWNVGYHNKKHFFTNPRWLAEGTAQMFETLADGGGANFGAVNTDRLGHYMSLEKSGELIPLKSFISTHKHFEEATIGTAYAESWALTHYLNRVKRKQLKAYVEIILSRPKNFKTTEAVELADFEKAFGKLDARWEKAWKEWMKKVRL